MLQNRAHAHFNSVHMVCPNVGPVYLHPRMPHPMDIGGGHSHIVGYMGNVISYSPAGYNTFALLGLVRSMALDLGPRGIRVNVICPGWVRTEMSHREMDALGERLGVGSVVDVASLPFSRPR